MSRMILHLDGICRPSVDREMVFSQPDQIDYMLGYTLNVDACVYDHTGLFIGLIVGEAAPIDGPLKVTIRRWTTHEETDYPVEY